MRKSPFVILGTVLGLSSVLGFQSKPATLSLGTLNATTTSAPPGSTSTTTASTTTTTSAPTTTKPVTTTTAAHPTTTTVATSGSSGGSTTTTTKPVTTTTRHVATTTTVKPTTTTTVRATTTTTSATRSATGDQVNYDWGILSVKVTATGTRITAVTIAYLDDGGNGRSQSIDQASIPVLEQEALTAQSANIQSVSGASYTSAGFTQSLQSALTTLGLA